MPATNQTALDNGTIECSTLVSRIKAISGASAYVAHPDGHPLAWEVLDAGYDGVQAVEYGATFWGNAINAKYAAVNADVHVTHWRQLGIDPPRQRFSG